MVFLLAPLIHLFYMLIKRRGINLIILVLIIFITFGLYIKRSYAQVCQQGFKYVECKEYNSVKKCVGPDCLWKCRVVSDNSDSFLCQLHSINGILKCGFYYQTGYCTEQPWPNKPIIKQCANAGGFGSFYNCGAPYYPPTPTPAPACIPSGNSCSSSSQCCNTGSGYVCSGGICCKGNGATCEGGGGSCCSSYCNGSVCANRPTPTPAPNCNTDTTNYGDSGCAAQGGFCGNTCRTPCNGTWSGPGSGLCAQPNYWQCCIPNTPTPTPIIPTNTPTPTRTPTPTTAIPTNTPTPTPAPAQPWFKLRDASLVGNTSINDPIPVSPLTPYDGDDPGNRYLLDNSAGSTPGVATGQNISIGGATVSSKNWKVAGKSYSPQFTVQKFVDYVKERKKDMVVEITQINQAQPNKINILSGDVTLTNGQLSSKRPLVLIVQGNVALSGAGGADINSSNQQQIIMSTGKIDFNTSVRTANGLYIADSLDFGTTANQGIKVIGNVISQGSFINERQWSNGKRPGLFIVFDPSHYLGLLDIFSTITYDWRQIQ